MDYLIHAPNYQHNSGGARVLHKLCHKLNQMGCNAYVSTSVINPKWDTPMATQEIQRCIIEEGIVVYPEVIFHNPLGAKRVVRYILNQPGLLGGDKVYAPEEMLFCHSQSLRQFVPSDDRVLSIQVIETDIFNNEYGGERTGGLFWVGKGHTQPRIPVTEGLTEITYGWPSSRKELAALFKHAEIFYTYDDFTALTTEALLCGCPAVIILSERVTPEEHRNGMRVNASAGLAYWNSDCAVFEASLRQARETVDAYFDNYLQYRSRINEQLERFVSITQAME